MSTMDGRGKSPGFNTTKSFTYDTTGNRGTGRKEVDGAYAPSVIGGASALGGQSYVSYKTQYTDQSLLSQVTSMAEDRRHPAIKGLNKVGTYFYDSDSGTVMNRSPIQLLQVIAYYICFYGALVAIFALCWSFFAYLVISDDVPYLSGDQNVIRMSPGIGLRPLPDYLTSLIRFRQGSELSYQYYTQHLQSFLDQYELFYNTESDTNIVDCNIITGHRGSENPWDPCRFDLDLLGPCNKQSLFGFPRGKPCVLLKINKVFGWLPDIINVTHSKNILVKCNGRFDNDKENIGLVKYYPSETIDGEEYGVISPLFFPFLSQVGYRNPLIAVQFADTTKNVIIMVECVFHNLRNVRVNPIYRMGTITFEYLID